MQFFFFASSTHAHVSLLIRILHADAYLRTYHVSVCASSKSVRNEYTYTRRSRTNTARTCVSRPLPRRDLLAYCSNAHVQNLASAMLFSALVHTDGTVHSSSDVYIRDVFRLSSYETIYYCCPRQGQYLPPPPLPSPRSPPSYRPTYTSTVPPSSVSATSTRSHAS